MANQQRKVQIVGNRSYAVSLPKKWVQQNRINISKVVNIYETADKLVISANMFDTSDALKISITVDKPETISGILLLCYVKGVSQIILKFSKSDQYLKSKKIIWEILSHLEGFKIIEESPESITIEYFYNKYEVTILKIVKRMVSIASQMIECIRLKDNQTKKILENEMDSLYHLSKRILYIASIDPQVRTKNNIQDIEEIFLWRLIFKKIENIGDLIDRLVFYRKETYLDIEKTLSNLNDLFIYSKLVDIAKIDILKNKKFSNEYTEKMNNLVIDILNNYLLIELNKKIFYGSLH